jgi:hypothetical protein
VKNNGQADLNHPPNPSIIVEIVEQDSNPGASRSPNFESFDPIKCECGVLLLFE